MRKEQKVYYSRNITQELGSQVIRYADQCNYVNFRDGTFLPDYKRRIANHEPATTPLTGEIFSLMCKAGKVEFIENGWKSYSDDSGGYRLSYLYGAVTEANTSPLTAQAQAKCKSDYFQQISSIRRAASGQVILGEIRETLGFLKKPWATGWKLLADLMTRRYKKIREYNSYVTGARRGKSITEINLMKNWLSKNTMRNIGDLWLEVRFGLLPLMQDCDDLIKIVNAKATTDDVVSYKAYGKVQDAKSSTLRLSGVYGVSQITSKLFKTTAQSYIRFGYRIKASSTADHQMALAQESFLNMRDLPSTAWELLPFSFLIDYFVNVGSIIEAVFEAQENVVWNSQSDILTFMCGYYGQSALPVSTSFVIKSFAPSSCEIKRRLLNRYTSSTVSIPQLTFGLPSSDIRLANIAALLTGLLNRKP